jgi:RNA polymerase primary sigma factor
VPKGQVLFNNGLLNQTCRSLSQTDHSLSHHQPTQRPHRSLRIYEKRLNTMRQLKISKQITNRETASLDMYLQDIGRVELISAQDEVELAKRIRSGDQRALDKLVKANLRFVVSVSKQYQNQGLSLPDLINEGNLGLIKAAQRFDETRGFKFISYAVWWIRQSILQALAEQSRIVRLPLNKIGAINKINKTASRLEQELEREPSYQEISEAIEMMPEEISDTMRNNNRHLSMDAPLSASDDGGNMYDLLSNEGSQNPDKGLMGESLQLEIYRALGTLSEREADVIKLYFGIGGKHPHSMEEIAEKFDLTRERVRQIKEKAVRRLKHGSRSRLLKAYLG